MTVARRVTLLALILLAPAGAGLSGCDGNGEGMTGVLRSVAALRAIQLSTGTLTPAFNAGVTTYDAVVDNATTSVTVTPVAAASGAVITVDGATVASGTASAPIPLLVGRNTVDVRVTNPDGATRTYAVVVTRTAA